MDSDITPEPQSQYGIAEEYRQRLLAIVPTREEYASEDDYAEALAGYRHRIGPPPRPYPWDAKSHGVGPGSSGNFSPTLSHLICSSSKPTAVF
jgi:hypothetical protein